MYADYFAAKCITWATASAAKVDGSPRGRCKRNSIRTDSQERELAAFVLRRPSYLSVPPGPRSANVASSRS